MAKIEITFIHKVELEVDPGSDNYPEQNSVEDDDAQTTIEKYMQEQGF